MWRSISPHAVTEMIEWAAHRSITVCPARPGQVFIGRVQASGGEISFQKCLHTLNGFISHIFSTISRNLHLSFHPHPSIEISTVTLPGAFDLFLSPLSILYLLSSGFICDLSFIKSSIRLCHLLLLLSWMDEDRYCRTPPLNSRYTPSVSAGYATFTPPLILSKCWWAYDVTQVYTWKHLWFVRRMQQKWQ